MRKKVRIRKKQGMSKTKRNFIWDIGITLGLLAAFAQDITGETVHEWLGLALLAGLVAHLLFHWKWVVNITKRIFNPKLKMKTRISYLINGGLLGTFIMMGVSGMMISESVAPTAGLSLGGSELWEDIHEAVSSGALVLVGSHLFLHWKWIASNSKKYLFNGLSQKIRLLRRDNVGSTA